ncbi:3496_t:CDS:1 [Acaulospora morrowiae]|uniref:3496_t:CDS:1 n=1 Tax=Acaulospora morrowiae TaxID=94023 RepID=A0A9N9HKB2_9GLOM|nr:3496_t:CDS:1 [Acaulospora morrowiae]
MSGCGYSPMLVGIQYQSQKAISLFDKNQPTCQPTGTKSKWVVDLLTEDFLIIDHETGSGSSTQAYRKEKKKPFLTIDELIKWLTKPEIKNNKKIRSKLISKTDEKGFNLMEKSDNKNNESSDSEYDTADEDSNIYFEKIEDPYINKIAEAGKFNKSEVYDYYVFMPKGFAKNEPLGFFESIEEKIANIYKRELVD